MIINDSLSSIKISNERSNFKLIPDIINLINKINKKFDFKIDGDIIISVKYGKRIVINCKNSNLTNLKKDDFIEIIDYNPIKKMILSIGPREPDFNMTIHWIIQKARRESNVLIQLNSNSLIKKIIKDKIENEKNSIEDSFEIAKDLLIKFRNQNMAYIKKYGIFLIGSNLKNMENIIYDLFEGFK